MHHFFVKNGQITEKKIFVEGEDYNHAVNVLRLRLGEEIMISDEDGNDYICAVLETDRDNCRLNLEIKEKKEENHELPSRIYLFQGLPKSDKIELIIQKATELGVSDIIPVNMKNCVAKLDPKKEESKLRRWRAVAESAAKQSKRSIVPNIGRVMNFTEAVKLAESFDVKILPYESEDGMAGMVEAIVSFLPERDIAVFIGPEGGFDPMEVKFAENHGVLPVSLGRRILRTETAAIAVLSMIMIRLEIAESMGFMEE